MTETEQAKIETPAEPTVPVAPEAEQEKAKSGGLRAAYFGVLMRLKPRPTRITVSKNEAKVDYSLITEIPKIAEANIDEVEMSPIKQNYSYVRIRYDNRANEYTYEVIEPKLTDDESDVLELLKETLVGSVDRMSEAEFSEKEKYLRRIVDELMTKLGITLHPISKEKVVYFVLRDFLGYGTIDVMMNDPSVEDCSCDGVAVPLYIYHRKYGSIRSNLKFEKESVLDGFVVWLAQKCGKHISVASPLLDATIPDGSRLQATLGKHVTKKGSSFTIRRFKENPFTPLDLLKFKTMSTEMMAYLWIGIEHGQSMLVCGGTASGKTTTLNAVLLFIPPQMKIVSIEDTRELNLPHENWVPGLTREGFGGKSTVTGRAAGEIDMFDLLTAAMRQRPQYLMVGEVRGKEAYVVFQAMATGKTCYSTFHAEDVQAMVHRMENDPINLPQGAHNRVEHGAPAGAGQGRHEDDQEGQVPHRDRGHRPRDERAHNQLRLHLEPGRRHFQLQRPQLCLREGQNGQELVTQGDGEGDQEARRHPRVHEEGRHGQPQARRHDHLRILQGP